MVLEGVVVNMRALPDSFSVRVTKEDIARGIKARCLECPVALALNRARPRPKGQAWSVQQPAVAIVSPRGFPQMAVDRSLVFRHDAGPFVEDFDNGKPLQPFTVRFQRVAGQ